MPWVEKRGDGEFPYRVKAIIGKLPNGRPKTTSRSGFATEDAAMNRGLEIEADARRGLHHDTTRGQITLDDYFWKKWLPAQTVADKSARNFASQYRTHIAPRWGTAPMNSIDTFDIGAFENALRKQVGQSQRRNVMDMLRFMLDDAVHAKVLQHSPMLPRDRTRRGSREVIVQREGKVATIAQVLAICDRLKPTYAMLTLVTLFTGMRWGEVAGMRREFLTLRPATASTPASGEYVIDPEIGAVKEDGAGRRAFGTPKGRKGRRVQLPPFLVEFLLVWLAGLPEHQELLFVSERAKTFLERSGFDNDNWRPACDGWPARPHKNPRWNREAAVPIVFGLWFHDLRHTHKTHLADGGIEPVARDERLGHVTPGMDGVYIHTTDAMRAKILNLLQGLWETAIAEEIAAGRSFPKSLPQIGLPAGQT